MTVMERIYGFMGQLMMERPARDKALSELVEDLERGRAKALEQMAAAGDEERNRETLRHVIAIERWGQARLRTVLDAQADGAGSDAFLPPAETAWETLHRQYSRTREETVALARQIKAAGIDAEETVQHDQWGDLSIRGWLYYLSFHAKKDLKTLRH